MSIRGYVYVLSNAAMPGLVKIGRSIEGGNKRARQIYQTGVPSPFDVEFEMMVSDCVFVEQVAHEALAECRVSGSREFFQSSPDDAQLAVISASLQLFGMVAVHETDGDAIYSVDEIAHRIDAHPIVMMSAIRRISDEEAIRCLSAENKFIDEFRHATNQSKKVAH